MSRQGDYHIRSNTGRQETGRKCASRRLLVLFILYVFCTLFYYFGELVDLAGLEAIRWDFLSSVHDVHRLLFLAPIIYAGYFFGIRAVIIITIVATNTMLPRALFISPFPDPLPRMVIFITIAGTMGYLIAVARHISKQKAHTMMLIESEKATLLEILERFGDGVIIIGPDYRVRFANQSMVRAFCEGTGSYCYEYLHHFDKPCPQTCRLPDVINGAMRRCEYSSTDGKIYEVIASPYIDSDGTACQLAIFKDVSQHKGE